MIRNLGSLMHYSNYKKQFIYLIKVNKKLAMTASNRKIIYIKGYKVITIITNFNRLVSNLVAYIPISAINIISLKILYKKDIIGNR